MRPGIDAIRILNSRPIKYQTKFNLFSVKIWLVEVKPSDTLLSSACNTGLLQVNVCLQFITIY